ncbi:uncharacterized protein STEHIDRAFT_37722, partial [Stereum hirsutum FP-91666 SS1]|uniref:uncharacterized protein n=1 Tax=Stereum hirsutum (strain FP-91666) TaxID=721885 RepID=UPI0004449BA3
FPTTMLDTNDTETFLASNWGLAKGQIENGASDLTFAQDPFPSNAVPSTDNSFTTSGGPVLQVLYSNGSYSNNNQGGAQFYSLWNPPIDSGGWKTMMVSYEVAFDNDFDWVKGGKLPGLRGGSLDGCSGGNQADGDNCFSTRIMWREGGMGEVYAYVPKSSSVCNETEAICNDKYGESLDRGSFNFTTGQWNRITLLVQTNHPAGASNGQISLYHNDVHVFSQTGVMFGNDSDVTPGGFYFSTFFGGSDSSWASSRDTHSYFRNVQLWASA